MFVFYRILLLALDIYMWITPINHLLITYQYANINNILNCDIKIVNN